MEIKRDLYLDKLIARKHNGLIKVVTGIRRCGKSYLLNTLFYSHLKASGVPDDHIVKFAFDSADDLLMIGENLIKLEKSKKRVDPEKFMAYISTKVVDNQMHYLLMDEVQLMDCFEAVLNGYLRKENMDVYVTGSNSKMLTKDVLTVFRGRGDEVRVYPVSFREYYAAVGGDKAEAYEEYALYGGMPLVLSRKTDADKMAYLQSLFTEVYFKDITERYDITLPDVLAELTDDLCSSVGSLTNASKIANTLGTVKNISVSSTTISNYLNYLMESFLFSNAKRYDVKGKKYFEYPSKYYCTDIGLRNARLNFRQQEETHIMENIIYNELLCRDYSVDVGVVEISETVEKKQSRKQCEIDFVVNRGAKKYYIQSALNVSDPAKMETELRPLKNTRDFFKKIIISKSSMKSWIDDDGILHLGLYEFLLNEAALDL